MSNVCSTQPMGDGVADREWMKGYEAARTRCLTRGADVAHRQRPTTANPAYESGYDWGLWDYEDANGLPHPHDLGA